MREYVGICEKCRKTMNCEDSFLNEVYEDEKHVYFFVMKKTIEKTC